VKRSALGGLFCAATPATLPRLSVRHSRRVTYASVALGSTGDDRVQSLLPERFDLCSKFAESVDQNTGADFSGVDGQNLFHTQ
jgi:hypothetical protein